MKLFLLIPLLALCSCAMTKDQMQSAFQRVAMAAALEASAAYQDALIEQVLTRGSK